MHNVYEFIKWALTHAKRESIPEDAQLPVAREECGTEKWEYLYGSTRVQTNRDTIDRYFNEHYYKSMSREKYDSYTKNWPQDGYATDCQGLLDAYMTYVLGEKTDINADMNYKYWCVDKGEIKSISRNFVLGEAVFMRNADTDRMKHVGWICGFTDGGEPLVIEARSIAYGVVVTRFNSRSWTHRGLMTKKFDYTAPIAEPIKLELKSPMMQGDYVLLMQKALNALHYTDSDGKPLEEDGKCGERTLEAVTAFANAHTAIEPKTITVIPEFVEKLVLEQYGLTVGVMHTEDIQEAANE